MRNRRAQALLTCALLTVAGLVMPLPAQAQPDGDKLSVQVVSSPGADLVTGGDALVRIVSAAPGGVTVTIGHRDVTEDFAVQPDGSMLGLVTGLPEGRSVLVARSGHRGNAVLHMVNHPAHGPVFSGPQQRPFFCETTAFGLAPASQPFCHAPAVVGYVYRTTAGAFAPLPDPASPPADIAQATVDGRQVPYMVRVERGVIDRAVYEIAALYDGRAPNPLRANDSWNKRLVYTFGGGCNVGYHQGANTGGVMDDLFLSQGYAVASSSLNVLDNNCSPIISAEVAMMVKEHVIETYGPVAHTIGWGGSGGAIQQYEIADNYPGILDGIVPQVSFPDPVTVGSPVADCRLLNRYFTAAGGFTPAQQAAVSGFSTFGSCVNWDRSFASRGNAMEACPPAIPPQFLYHPTTNPGGIKCTTAEQLVTQLGRDPDTGFARGYYDNIGVQFGLAALRAGTITPEQFVGLNARIGGYDVAGNPIAARTAADPVGLVRVYRSGLVLNGRGGLARTPIIDLRVYTDAVNDIHTRFWSFVTRERLIQANGTADNQVILTYSLVPSAARPQAYALAAMDGWLTAQAKPGTLTDGCWTPAGQLVSEPATWHGSGTCNSLYPAAGDTRLAAGATPRDDTLKCRLVPIDFTAYPVTFTPEQQARLGTAFPEGVCDYGSRGIGQLRPAGVWQSYGN
ncbi:MAG TPA: DUF6351 family protein [Candidatus Limnocylindrales bacterium]|nr:DUF6351 family protein [Candidatus Limnocylindrales bacterium]